MFLQLVAAATSFYRAESGRLLARTIHTLRSETA